MNTPLYYVSGRSSSGLVSRLLHSFERSVAWSAGRRLIYSLPLPVVIVGIGTLLLVGLFTHRGYRSRRRNRSLL